MRKIEEIEQQIRELSSQELRELRAWFLQQDWESWDMQIESDSRSGKWDQLVADAKAEYEKGKARKL